MENFIDAMLSAVVAIIIITTLGVLLQSLSMIAAGFSLMLLVGIVAASL